MKNDQLPLGPSNNRSSLYSNPNEKMIQPNSTKNPPSLLIKKTFSQMHSKSSNRSSINSQNLNPKIPQVILQFIAEKTRQQNQNRINDSKQINRRKTLLNLNRKSRFSNISNDNQLFQQQNEPIQKPEPTGNIRRSIAAFKIPQIDSRRSSKHKIQCPICLTEGPKKQFIAICDDQCQHQYCRSCIHQYVIYKIKMFQKVTCPDQNCNVTLKLNSQLYAELPIDTREIFKKILQYNEVMQSDNKRICPNQECNGVLDVTDPQKNPRCEKCRIVYCRKCFFKNHAGQCDPFQLKFFQQTLNYRQCNKCKNVIEKNQGCNHMTCRCGYQFCYVCGARWTNTHICEQLMGEPYVPDRWNCCCFQCDECDICLPLDYCCECMCFDDWQICEIRPIRWFFKVLIILLVLIIGIPLWIVYLTFHLVVNIFMGIIVGLFVLPCEPLCDVRGNCQWIIMGILFLPITIIVFIVMGIKQMLIEDEALDDIREELYLPCQVVNQIIEL